MLKTIYTLSAIALSLTLLPATAEVLSSVNFVNGITISGGSQDLSTGNSVDRRVGFFSDIYYDPNRKEWWGVSDRGPGGGLLSYETRA